MTDSRAMNDKKILLIEDSPDLSFLYKKSLSTFGVAIEHANSGRSALSLLQTLKPSLIIMDLTLGDMSVEDFYSQFSSVEATQEVPLILISGREDVLSWADLFGASFVAKKPVDMVRFRKAVQELLQFDDDTSAEVKRPASPTLI